MDDGSVLEIMKACHSAHSDFLLYTTTEIVGTTGGKQKLLDKLSKDAEMKITEHSFIEMVEIVDFNILKVLVIEYDEEVYKALYEKIEIIKYIEPTKSQIGFIDCGKQFVNK